MDMYPACTTLNSIADKSVVETHAWGIDGTGHVGARSLESPVRRYIEARGELSCVRDDSRSLRTRRHYRKCTH